VNGDPSQALIGVFGVDLSIDAIRSSVLGTKLFTNGYGFVVDNKETPVIHPLLDPNVVSQAQRVLAFSPRLIAACHSTGPSHDLRPGHADRDPCVRLLIEAFSRSLQEPHGLNLRAASNRPSPCWSRRWARATLLSQ
jgi:hypothetical protein